MELKHLTLRGFKSFADRTRLDFSPGVNVVVGPNGAGKSNILDAIAWVMGTQGTKSLRTEKMEDVVFAGTATRPAHSRAEVALTFANSAQIMPFNLAEITIIRRLFRDGTSEYELNGAPCRLLDIQELLSDGGIGKNHHVLVSQGEVGDVLNARPEDHRVVIEEAAGVTKHRSRRERAMRRLERTDHDLERILDILAEKKRAMRPLKRQANAAERHDSVRDEAQALRLWLGGEDLRTIAARLKAASAERRSTGEIRSSADDELETVRAEITSLRSGTAVAVSALETDTAAAARLETARERLRRISVVARERADALSARLVGADERREDLEGEEQQLVEGIAVAEEDERLARENAERKETLLLALEDEERSLTEQVQLPAEGIVANLRGDLRALETAERRDSGEADQTSARWDAVAERIAVETSKIEELNGLVQGTDIDATAYQDVYVAKKDARIVAESEWRTAEERAADQRLVLAGADAREKAFVVALDGLVDEETRQLATEAEGVLGAIVERLDVPSEIAASVDAALGEWSGALVAQDASALEAVVDRVKVGGSGGVSFVVAPGSSTRSAIAVAREFGVDALVDLLGPEAERELALGIIGDVVLVQGWKAGWRVVSEAPEVRAVTPEGDVITRFGMIVAQPDGAGPAALEAARTLLEVAERDLARDASRAKAAKRTFNAVADDERSALEKLEASEARLAGFAEALGLVDRARAASQGELERLNGRISALTEARFERDERIKQLRVRVSEFEGEEAVRQTAWDALNRRRDEVAIRREGAKRDRELATGELASVAERQKMMKRRREVVAAETTQLVLLPSSQGDVGQLRSISARAESAIAVVSDHIASLRDEQRERRAMLARTNREISEAEERRENLGGVVRTTGDSLAVLDIELAELGVRQEAVLERLRRDADATRDQAVAAEQPELGEGVDPRQRLESLEADLRRMGPINPLAANEYSELAKETTELEDQLGDLNESRSELRKVVSALDEKMTSLFLEAFEEVAAFYAKNFALVFPGGTGRLRLTDPGDPHSTGIVVEAQPAGKKIGRLSLLSGGERSLAALAFLFAVFQARPSPFYVLDEVDAALDDANLHRFLRLVDTLRESVQLVVITHQQQTMEAADVLYGVTMEPGESSVVLSKRMTVERAQNTEHRVR